MEWFKKHLNMFLKARGEISLGVVIAIILIAAVSAIYKSNAPLIERVAFLIAAIGFVFSATNFYVTIARPYFAKPIMKMLPDKRQSDNDIYIGLRVQNLGRQRAKSCVVRLLDIRGIAYKHIWADEQFPQLNFYWERQNQINQFSPVDIWGNQYTKFLDVAIYNIKSKNFWLRLYTDNQALPQKLPMGLWENVGRLPIEEGTYYLQIALYGEDEVFVAPRWYTLSCTNGEISLNETHGENLRQLRGIQ